MTAHDDTNGAELQILADDKSDRRDFWLGFFFGILTCAVPMFLGIAWVVSQ